MVVEEITGVVNEVPVPSDVPPVAALYQFNVPALAVAPNVTVPVPQRLAGVVAVMVGEEKTEICTLKLVDPFAVLNVQSGSPVGELPKPFSAGPPFLCIFQPNIVCWKPVVILCI